MGRVGLEWSGWCPSKWAQTNCPFLFVRNLFGDDLAFLVSLSNRKRKGLSLPMTMLDVSLDLHALR